MQGEKNTKPVRLGVIGCGIAARELHWPAIQQLPHLYTMTAVCNHTEPKAREFASLVGDVPYHLDYRDLLQMDSVEAVLLALPVELNLPVTQAALAAGKHVLVEKPLAVDLSEAERMLELERNTDRVVMLAENYRYRPTFRRVRELIQSGRVGQPYAGIWDIFHHRTIADKYAQTQWRIQHKYAGGFITDVGVHYVAALRYILGDFISGTALVHSINPEIGRTDTCHLQFRTVNGINGQLNILFTAHGMNEEKLTVFGSRGTLQLEGNDISILTADDSRYEERVPYSGGFLEEYEDFYHAIRTGSEVKSTLQEGFEDLKILLLALEAAGQDQIVRF